MLVNVPAGTALWRVHSTRFPAAVFNPTPATNPLRGGRFDTIDGKYGCLYAAKAREAAVAEVLVRDIPVDGKARVLPRVMLRDRLLTRIAVKTSLLVVSLHGPDLGHVGQDSWLTKCEKAEYALTRAWGAALRKWAPDAAGFVWRSKRDEDWLAYVFFEDRLPSPQAIVKVGRSLHLDSPRGFEFVRKILARHNVGLLP